MLDEMGFNQQQDFAWGNMQVMLTKGQKFNLSGTTHNAGITLSGNGTYVLDKIKIQSNFGKPAKLVLDLSKEGIVVEADGASIEELIIKNTADVDVSKSKVDFRNSTVEKTRISMKQKEQVLPCQGFQINGECITEDDKNKRKK